MRWPGEPKLEIKAAVTGAVSVGLRLTQENCYLLFVGYETCRKEYHCSSKAARREDLQVEEPVVCWDGSSFDFHPTLAGMLRTPLVGHEVIQMGEPAQKRLLAPFGMSVRIPRTR